MFRRLRGDRERAQCLGMRNFTDLPSVPSDHLVPFTDQLRLAVAAYLARFKGASSYHTESDLRCYLTWCAERGLDPLAARRPHLELYIRWMQEVRRFKPSTVSRRFSVAAGFYRTCVIDGLLDHSPAEHVRRPSVPPESPTLGFTHLQFEALLTAARESANPCNFALVAMLGLRIFEATGADITDLGEEHGHRSCAYAARAPRSSSSRCHLPSGMRHRGRSLQSMRPSTGPTPIAERDWHSVADAQVAAVTRGEPTFGRTSPAATERVVLCRGKPGGACAGSSARPGRRHPRSIGALGTRTLDQLRVCSLCAASAV
jgi:hypothetical protein